ncbi:hypothetical protein PGTUg99_026072 [Puccinia graminis f. sp. tritici]|uniref:Uncharacterized protein n=1 Tax=Puccinia graminis f. sp. tritici TaxID=56615 RepID=A0A5B0PJH6_PUCGR|nr:hypothetical protein PGTUg99_026072 [Puccinia graminis f. sp. tritici]
MSTGFTYHWTIPEIDKSSTDSTVSIIHIEFKSTRASEPGCSLPGGVPDGCRSEAGGPTLAGRLCPADVCPDEATVEYVGRRRRASRSEETDCHGY